jgi:hypothetical protein
MEKRNQCRLNAYRRVQRFVDEHATDPGNAYQTNTSLPARFALSDDKASAISRLIKEAVEEGRIKSEGGSRRGARYVPYYPNEGEDISQAEDAVKRS